MGIYLQILYFWKEKQTNHFLSNFSSKEFVHPCSYFQFIPVSNEFEDIIINDDFIIIDGIDNNLFWFCHKREKLYKYKDHSWIKMEAKVKYQ